MAERSNVDTVRRTSDLSYRGTFEAPEVDFSGLGDVIDEYNNVRQDEFDRLEKNLESVSELENEIFKQKFNSIGQKKKYEQLREKYNLDDKSMLGVDLTNSWSRMEYQRRAAEMHGDPEYMEIERAKAYEQALLDDVQENPDLYAELAPRFLSELNNSFENTDPENVGGIFKVKRSDYLPVDPDDAATEIIGNMEDTIRTELKKVPDASEDYLVEVKQKSGAKIEEQLRSYLLQDQGNIENTNEERGLIEIDDDGVKTVTERGEEWLDNKRKLHEKWHEEYQTKLDKGERQGLQGGHYVHGTLRYMYNVDGSAKYDQQVKNIDNKLLGYGINPRYLNRDAVYADVLNYAEKESDDPGIGIADFFLANKDQLNERAINQITGQWPASGERAINDNGHIVDSEGETLTVMNENGNEVPLTLTHLFSNMAGDYRKAIMDLGASYHPQDTGAADRGYGDGTDTPQQDGGDVQVFDWANDVLNDDSQSNAQIPQNVQAPDNDDFPTGTNPAPSGEPTSDAGGEPPQVADYESIANEYSGTAGSESSGSWTVRSKVKDAPEGFETEPSWGRFQFNATRGILPEFIRHVRLQDSEYPGLQGIPDNPTNEKEAKEMDKWFKKYGGTPQGMKAQLTVVADAIEKPALDKYVDANITIDNQAGRVDKGISDLLVSAQTQGPVKYRKILDEIEGKNFESRDEFIKEFARLRKKYFTGEDNAKRAEREKNEALANNKPFAGIRNRLN